MYVTPGSFLVIVSPVVLVWVVQLPWDLLLLPMCTERTNTLITTHIVQSAADSTHTQTQQSATRTVPLTTDSTHTHRHNSQLPALSH